MITALVRQQSVFQLYHGEARFSEFLPTRLLQKQLA